jgi:hypothetical protein
MMQGYLIDEQSFEMVAILVEFVAERGFDGFTAFIDQRVKECDEQCECGGQLHGMTVEPSVIRTNLERLRSTIEGARR